MTKHTKSLKNYGGTPTQIMDAMTEIRGFTKYEREKGGYRVRDLVIRQIAICYEEDQVDGAVMLLKHGPPRYVNEYAVVARRAFVDGGHISMAKGIKVVTLPKDFPAETVNHWIACTGAFGVWLKKRGLTQ